MWLLDELAGYFFLLFFFFLGLKAERISNSRKLHGEKDF